MIVKKTLIMAALVTSMTGGAAFAAEAVLRGEDSPYQLRASDLLGMDVINTTGDEIGEIDDLTVSPDGSIQAVLALGGFLGMGEKMVTLGFDNMQFDDEREHLVVNVTEEELESMENFNYLEGENRGRDITPGKF